MGREIDEVLAAIEQRIAAAQTEIASLEVARSVLGGVGALTGRSVRDGQSQAGDAGHPRSRRATRRQRTARPPRADATELKRLLADADGGLSASALAELAGVPAAKVRAQLRELERAGEVRSTGERRGTRWTLVTDEDRIAHGVAELERSRATPSAPR
jgi:IclR helix-turn-helix domain